MFKNKFLIFCLLLLFSLHGLTFKAIEHPVRSVSFWGDYNKKSLLDKIQQKTPAELVDYIRQDNKANGWPNQPLAAQPTQDFLTDLKKALQELPFEVQSKINEKLIGIYFVTDLGGSAYTEYVVNSKGQETAGFVIIDISALNRKANEWATWKEASPFHFHENEKLEALIETPEENNRKNALQYILLHEFGHILSIGSPLLPKWGTETGNAAGVSPETLKDIKSMRFFNISWLIKDNKWITRTDSSWTNRSRIHYYAPPEAQLPATEALMAYTQLSQSHFPTLYAATNPSDDFAETFAQYTHVLLLKKPWQITIQSGAKKITIHPCWTEARCREKKTLMKELLRL